MSDDDDDAVQAAEQYISARTINSCARAYLGRLRVRRSRLAWEDARIGGLVQLGLYWDAEAGDHRLCTAAAAGATLGSRRHTFLRWVGCGFDSEEGRECDVVALHCMHSVVRGDTRVVPQPMVEACRGYRDLGRICYAYLHHRPGTVPLRAFFSADRGDSLALTVQTYRCDILERARRLGRPYAHEGVLGHILVPPPPGEDVGAAAASAGRGTTTPTAAQQQPPSQSPKPPPPLHTAASAAAARKRLKRMLQEADARGQGAPQQRPSQQQQPPPPPPSSAALAPQPPPPPQQASSAAAAAEAVVLRLACPSTAKVTKLDRDRQQQLVRRLHDREDERRLLRLERLALTERRRRRRGFRLSLIEERDSVERLFYADGARATQTAARLNREHATDLVPPRTLSKAEQRGFLERLRSDGARCRERREARLLALEPPGPPAGSLRRPKEWLEVHAAELYANVHHSSRTPRPD